MTSISVGTDGQPGLSGPPSLGRSLVVTGFAAVDVTYGEQTEASAGGTAVNVARAARRLGWDVEAVGTVGADPAGDLLLRVLEEERVGTRHLLQDPRWTTPVVLQERRGDDHVWRFRCPVCGARFARHRPSPLSRAEPVTRDIPTPDVFFFDRTSRFSLELARRWGAAGSTVVFEPAMLGRPHLFDAAAAVADVVKFSAERSGGFGTRLSDRHGVTIETLGKSGARFIAAPSSQWTYVAAHEVGTVVDSAGAGDWTTAGLITEITNEDGGLTRDETLRSALRNAQQLGSAACGWSGVFPGHDAVMQPEQMEAFACPVMNGPGSHFPRPSQRDLIAL